PAIDRALSIIHETKERGGRNDRKRAILRNEYYLGVGNLLEKALARNVYGTAYGHGRRKQLGIDGAALIEQIENVTSRQIHEAAEKFYAPERIVTSVFRASATPSDQN
ncbi:MAG: hypothetical protein AAF492_19585, partial [Verrucomicrobiota bacterium]